MQMQSHRTSSVVGILEAASVAARAHQGQLRKDGETPYVSHVFRVCLILRHLFEIDEENALAAALLHDVLEDSTTDFDDLEKKFGTEIATWVAALSKDSRLPFARREEEYRQVLAAAPWQVQVCKLADVADNLLDSAHLSAGKRREVIAKIGGYIDAIASNLQPEAKRAWDITSALHNEMTNDQ